jgi:hypothetical protein
VPQDGETPLYYASRKGRADVVGALLAKGADVEAKDNVSIEYAWLPSGDLPLFLSIDFHFAKPIRNGPDPTDYATERTRQIMPTVQGRRPPPYPRYG